MKTPTFVALTLALAACGSQEANQEISNEQAPGAIQNAVVANVQQSLISSSEPPSTDEPKVVSKRTLIGEWINVGQKCIEPKGDEYVEGSNLKIQASSIGGFEWGCDLKPSIGADAKSYAGKQICMGDGVDETPTAIALELLPDGTLKLKDSNGVQTLRRCD